MTKKSDALKKHLQEGQVYRRAELAQWSNAIDRHLKLLLAEGTLQKLSGGLYYCPEKTRFGNAPAEEDRLVESFLRDHRFLVTSPNAYNALGVGTTQLYNETVVYNHKRHGRFKLGGRVFDFRLKHFFPENATTEFLLVDLVNNLDRLAEDAPGVLDKVAEKAASMKEKPLLQTVREYGNMRAKKFFESLFAERTLNNAV